MYLQRPCSFCSMVPATIFRSLQADIQSMLPFPSVLQVKWDRHQFLRQPPNKQEWMLQASSILFHSLTREGPGSGQLLPNCPERRLSKGKQKCQVVIYYFECSFFLVRCHLGCYSFLTEFLQSYFGLILFIQCFHWEMKDGCFLVCHLADVTPYFLFTILCISSWLWAFASNSLFLHLFRGLPSSLEQPYLQIQSQKSLGVCLHEAVFSQWLSPPEAKELGFHISTPTKLGGICFHSRISLWNQATTTPCGTLSESSDFMIPSPSLSCFSDSLTIFLATLPESLARILISGSVSRTKI